MNLLGILAAVGVFAVLLYVGWASLVAVRAIRRLSREETGSAVDRTEVPEPLHPNCRHTYTATVDSSGDTLTLSSTETSTTRARDGPKGYRGEDLTDGQVDEWLRYWGLNRYE